MSSIRTLAALLALALCCTACTAPHAAASTTASTAATSTAASATTTSTAATETDPPAPPAAHKRVALTFDDGPAFDSAGFERSTYRLVDKLAAVGGRATFFLVGDRINETTAPAIAYAAAHGCEIGVHAYTHRYDFSSCAESIFLSELARTRTRIERITGKPVTLFRPPYGAITDERAARSGLPVILWSLDSEDWRHKSRENSADAAQNIRAIADRILENVRDGDIILMHDIYRNSFEAACIVIDELTARGYALLTVTELIGAPSLQVGVCYSDGTAAVQP